MLSKLLKHEFKATARLILPLYLVLFVFTIVARFVLSLDLKGALSIFPAFATIAYIATILAIAVVSFVIIVLRFYKNLMTDEGYLMFTLPVKAKQLINSKLLVSLFWYIASLLLILVSLFGLLFTKEHYGLIGGAVERFFTEMRLVFGTSNMILFITETFLVMILGLINNILIIYASIAIGQLFNGHKILGSIAAYIGISTALQIIVSAAFVILGIVFGTSFDEVSSVPEFILPITIAFVLITNILFYVVTDFIFKKKLNLE